MTGIAHREFDLIVKAGFVLLALQFALFAELWATGGFDAATDDRFPTFVMVTGLFVAAQRRLAASPPSRGAARWMVASRVAVLAMLTLGTLTVAFYRLVPDAAPAPDAVPRALFALLWVIIALKGAALGKLRPGSPVGLYLPGRGRAASPGIVAIARSGASSSGAA